MELEKLSLSEWLGNPNTAPSYAEDKDFKTRFADYCKKNGLNDKKVDIDEYSDILDKFNEDWDNEEIDKEVEEETSNNKTISQQIADDTELERIEKAYNEDDLDEYIKELDDYASKNPKGREDIPATYKR